MMVAEVVVVARIVVVVVAVPVTVFKTDALWGITVLFYMAVFCILGK